jgi:hypothetical protein
LKNKQQGEAGLTIKVRAPDQETEKPNENEGLEAAAADIISAVHMKDHKALASALKAAYDMCESAPETETNETETQGDED